MHIQNRDEIARRVRAARGFAGLSQRELADALGVDIKTVNRWENRHWQPDRGRMTAIIVICGVRVDWFDDSFSLNGRAVGEPAQAGASPGPPTGLPAALEDPPSGGRTNPATGRQRAG